MARDFAAGGGAGGGGLGGIGPAPLAEDAADALDLGTLPAPETAPAPGGGGGGPPIPGISIIDSSEKDRSVDEALDPPRIRRDTSSLIICIAMSGVIPA